MGKTVLVADDSAMMRKIVSKNLKEISGGDITIVEAGDGKEALEAFQKGGIEMVLTDWNMPNMTGIELVTALRKLDPDKKIPIIMVTSEATADKVKEAVMAGVNNYISKPFTPDVFKEKLGSML